MNALSVFAPRRFGRLAASDATNISRDPMLLIAIGFSVLPAIGLWAFRARMDAAALDAFGIADFGRYTVPVVLLIPALLIGWVAGFLMLEDRDDGPLIALDVTPAGKLGFIAYRLVAAALLTAAITLGSMPLIAPEVSFALSVLLALLVAATAAGLAVILPAIARNKVEGLALTKLTNIASLIPLAVLLPTPFRYLAGILPPYWIGELLLPRPDAIPMALAVVLAITTHLAALALLMRLLMQRAG